MKFNPDCECCMTEKNKRTANARLYYMKNREKLVMRAIRNYYTKKKV